MAEISKIEQEALRRAQEMQGRVQQTQGGRPNPFNFNINNHPNRQQKSSPQRQEHKEQRKQEQHNEPVFDSSNEHHHENSQENGQETNLNMPNEQNNSLLGLNSKGMIDVLMKDKERNLILILILILSGEESDPSLILALMFLII